MSQTENRLKNSASPYLRSAAHQPVDWYEWGPEAFARARQEEKPVLLDIGAVWCHWCHVIDRESYENSEIAEVINRFFVPVKVDRDERPDVDARYQAAIGAIAGQGGWPLTGFLTPEGKPFFGGTYFPPEDAMGRPGFKRILLAAAEAFAKRRSEVEQSAAAVEQAAVQAETLERAAGKLDPRVIETMTDAMLRQFDKRHGGFGQSPKFPHSSAVDLILERHQSTREAHLLTVAEKTLEGMACGGVYDQLGGGFHRYSVDERWLVPHFEKMSYDNSELLKNYIHGFQVTRRPLFREIANGIVDWVFAVLSDQNRGGVYASQDADYSLDDDGDYFTWTQEEVRAVLRAEEARITELYYDVGARGEMHHNPAKNVLWVAQTPEEIAGQTGRSEADVRLTIARAKGKMQEARQKRPAPGVDTTLYAGWNAMFASALFEAGPVLGRSDCREFALKTLERLLAEAWDQQNGFAHRIGGPYIGGILDDQVFATAALLDAYEATLDPRYLGIAERAMEIALGKYWDGEGSGFLDRAADAPKLPGLQMRRKAIQDAPTPAGNSAAAIVLERLYGLTGNARYRDRCQETLEAFAGIAPQLGLFAATYALAALLHSRHSLQVVITGAAYDERARALEAAGHQVYRFGKAVFRVTPQDLAKGLSPALRETIPNVKASEPRALVCQGASCQPPMSDPQELAELLAGTRSGAGASFAVR